MQMFLPPFIHTHTKGNCNLSLKQIYSHPITSIRGGEPASLRLKAAFLTIKCGLPWPFEKTNKNCAPQLQNLCFLAKKSLKGS